MNTVTILETQRTRFAQWTIIDGKCCTRLREVLERNIPFIVLIVQDSVAMAKRTAFSILTGQADGSAIRQDRGEGQGLGLSPVDTALRAKRGRPALQQACQFRVGSKPFRPAKQFLIVARQLLSRNLRWGQQFFLFSSTIEAL